MRIPLKAKPYNRPPLELVSIQLYSTGLKGKVYTKKFYKSMNHNFGVEMKIKNNTQQRQNVKIGGCIYDSNGNVFVRWKTKTKQIFANNTLSSDYYVIESSFSQMHAGTYKVQFWINDQKVQRDFFTVSYK